MPCAIGPGASAAALAACQESLRWAEIADDRPGMLTQELNIGDLALALGDWALAERSFQRAQSMAAALSDATGALRARLGLAQISLRQGRFDEARLAFQQASDEARGRDVAAEVVALNGLGLTYRALGETSAGERPGRGRIVGPRSWRLASAGRDTGESSGFGVAGG